MGEFMKNPNGKKFSWSPSAINDFLTCPLQYAAKRYYETLPFIETQALRDGNIEHKHLENRLKLKTPLPKGFDRGEKYCQALEKTGKVTAEFELALAEDKTFTSWRKGFGRLKIDALVKKKNKLSIIDWKTGKPKDDLLQLKIYAAVLSLLYPDIEVFNTRYVWLKFDHTSGAEFYKDEIPGIWQEIDGHIDRMKQAWLEEDFQPRPSGLCRNYCAVSACEYCGKGAR